MFWVDLIINKGFINVLNIILKNTLIGFVIILIIIIIMIKKNK